MSGPADPASGSTSTERALLLVVLLLFGALTAVTISVEGIGGFAEAIRFNWSSLQIYVDLVIAIVVLSVWIHRDARARGRSPWPWIAASFVVGMFGPLVYLLTRRSSR